MWDQELNLEELTGYSCKLFAQKLAEAIYYWKEKKKKKQG